VLRTPDRETSAVRKAGPEGLTSAQEVARRREFGPNILPSKRPFPAWRHLLHQLVHFFAIMLWIAGILAILAGMPQLGLAIFAVICLNGLFAFIQEHRAERTNERLNRLLPRRATVLRDAKFIETDADELVPDDVVLLKAGDRISADLRLLEGHGLSIDTSAMTGESAPWAPQEADTLYAGTLVLEGEATGIVTATGNATRLAHVARATFGSLRPKSPLALELDHVVRVIALVSSMVGVLFLAIAVLVGIRISDAILFALGVTVALVPEGLLPTVTLSLASGAQRMASRHALVRRLESVETLGSTTFICTDKTGTLTLNQMAVVEVWTAFGSARREGVGSAPNSIFRPDDPALPAARDLVLAAARCSKQRVVWNGSRPVAPGDPLEAAIHAYARSLEINLDADELEHPVRKRFPFDPRRRRMSVVVGDRLIVKGAPESVLPRCPVKADADAALKRMASRGLRVLAVATRPVSEMDEFSEEAELNLLGMLGIEDPPRPGIAASLMACRQGGIRIAMVTGDHVETARTIAEEVGLWKPGAPVLEGCDLPQDDELLGALIDRDGTVIGRVTPEDKLRIAQALRKRGHIVAMTGDGVNDAPALQAADIGIAMGRIGTDVAREAADLILLDDNFASIVAAVELGRTTFANMRRFLTYHLTDNVAELTPFVVWALSGGRFPLALGVLQVLSLDLGTDIFPALALGVEPPSPNVLQNPPAGRRLLDKAVMSRAFGLLGPVESFLEIAAFLGTFVAMGWRPGDPFPAGNALLTASGAAFSAVVFGQLANAFACRSATRWPGSLGWSSNRFLLAAVIVELLLLGLFLYAGPLALLLGQGPPNRVGWMIAALVFPAVLIADAVHKRLRSRGRLTI
jgi:magnesium-transporting ATPase (P-type)